MKPRDLFVIVIFFFTSLCWTMDHQHSQVRNPDKYYDDLILEKRHSTKSEDLILSEISDTLRKNLDFIDDLLKNISSQKTNLLHEFNFTPEKLCEQTICGNDWFVYSEHHAVLKAEVPIVVPIRKWRSYNCEIIVTKIAEKEVNITIIPEAFPIFGDHHLKEATWKAEIWLEEKAHNRPDVSSKKIQEKIIELDTCKLNLEKEKEIILLKQS